MVPSGAKREPGIGTFPAKIKVLVGENELLLVGCCDQNYVLY
jgi:hypothetical protein